MSDGIYKASCYKDYSNDIENYARSMLNVDDRQAGRLGYENVLQNATGCL